MHSLAGDARTLAGRKVCFPRFTLPENTDSEFFFAVRGENSARLSHQKTRPVTIVTGRVFLITKTKN